MKKEIAVALRSELYGREELLHLATILESAPGVSHVFFPDIPNGLESIELSMAVLGATKRLKVGSGVVRLAEHDPKTFGRRLETIQYLSRNRFVLGIGTGSPGKKPSDAIGKMFDALEATKDSFAKNSGRSDAAFPYVLVAALRSRMAEAAMKRADGLLLNFCSPAYARELISEASSSDYGGNQGKKTMACYIKLFYSESQREAETALIQEFLKYDTLPQYHKMFENDGVADAISDLRGRLSKGESVEVPDSLKIICLANPSEDQLRAHLEEYVRSGVDLPCVYPYFRSEGQVEFKMNTLKSIASTSL